MDDIRLSRSGKEQAGATPEEIAEALRVVDAAGNGEEFVILSRADDSFLQYNGIDLEYREGDRQFRAAGDPSLVAMFQDFARGGSEWKAQRSWNDIGDLLAAEQRGRWLSVLYVAIVFVVLVAAVVIPLWLYGAFE